MGLMPDSLHRKPLPSGAVGERELPPALLKPGDHSLEALIDTITPEIHDRLQSAIELGKWEDGGRLSPEQVEYCMQAVILYEARHLPEETRTGSPLNRPCDSRESEIKPLSMVSDHGTLD